MVVLMYLIAAVALAIPAFLICTRRLLLARDFFFLSVYLQILLFLHIIPPFDASSVPPALHPTYCLLQALAIPLFEVPLVWIYLTLMKRSAAIPAMPTVLRVVPWRMVVFSLAPAVLAVGHFYVSLENGLFVRWLHSYYPIAMASLPRWQFYAYRSLVQIAPFFMLFFLVTFDAAQKWPGRRLCWLCMAVVIFEYMLQAAMNSREDSALAIVAMVGVFVVRSGRDRWLTPKHVGLLLVAGVFIAYLARVALIARSNYPIYGFLFEYFDPFWGEAGSFGGVPRMNGMDLITMIADSASRIGYAWGRAWLAPIYVVFGDVVGAPDVAWMKEKFAVTARYYLLLHYTNIENPTMDYGQGMLTDMFGNFGWLGMVLAAPVLALPLAYGTVALRRPRSLARFSLGVALLICASTYDQEAISIFLRMMKMMPALALTILLRPWRVVSAPYEAARQAMPSSSRSCEARTVTADPRFVHQVQRPVLKKPAPGGN